MILSDVRFIVAIGKFEITLPFIVFVMDIWVRWFRSDA